MNVYDLINENSPITLTELSKRIDETMEATERYLTELEKLGLIEIEYVQKPNPEKIVKLKKDFLLDNGYNKIRKKLNKYIKQKLI